MSDGERAAGLSAAPSGRGQPRGMTSSPAAAAFCSVFGFGLGLGEVAVLRWSCDAARLELLEFMLLASSCSVVNIASSDPREFAAVPRRLSTSA